MLAKGRVMTSDSPLLKRDLLILGSLFLLEAAIVIILQALHIKGETSFDVFLPRLPGMVFLCAGGVFSSAAPSLFAGIWSIDDHLHAASALSWR